MIPFVLEVVDGELDRSLYFGEDRVSPPSVWNGHPLTCQRCDGTGCDIDFCQQCGDEYTDPCQRHAQHVNWTDDDNCCPDCVDGHPIIEVDCPHCMKCYDDDCPTCDECCEFGSVRVSVQAVLIVRGACPDPTNAPHRRAHVHLSEPSDDTTAAGYCRENCDLVWDSPWKSKNALTLPDDARPGQFAIIATPVPAESPIEGDDQ